MRARPYFRLSEQQTKDTTHTLNQRYHQCVLANTVLLVDGNNLTMVQFRSKKKRTNKSKCARLLLALFSGVLLSVAFVVYHYGEIDLELHTNTINRNLAMKEKMDAMIRKYPFFHDEIERRQRDQKNLDHRRHDVSLDPPGKRRPRVEKVMQDLPNHCPDINRSIKHSPRSLVIRGERHTGTHLLRKIVDSNTSPRNLKVIDHIASPYGWKHGFLPPKGWGVSLPSDAILLVITRDIFTWLPKMYKETYNSYMNSKRNLRFSDFIRAEYGTACDESVIPKKLESKWSFSEPKIKGRLITKLQAESPALIESAENIIQIRTQKYKQWLSDNPDNATYTEGSKDAFLKNRIWTRLESLSDVDKVGTSPSMQKKSIGDALLNSCVPIRMNFTEATEYTKWNTTHNVHAEAFDVNFEKKQMLVDYTKEDLRFVLSQLDLEFEKKIGYDYSYVYEMLDESAP